MTFSDYIDKKITIAVTKEEVYQKYKQKYKLAKLTYGFLPRLMQCCHQNLDEVLADLSIEDDVKEMVREMYLSDKQ